MTTGLLSSRNITLAGFRSRWMMPRSWATWSASASVRTIRMRLRHAEAAALLLEQFRERRPGDALHDQVGDAPVLADVEDLADRLDVAELRRGCGPRA